MKHPSHILLELTDQQYQMDRLVERTLWNEFWKIPIFPDLWYEYPIWPRNFNRNLTLKSSIMLNFDTFQRESANLLDNE